MANLNNLDIKKLLFNALAKEKSFFWLIASYALVIALINLALPISIQMLINSIAYTALIQPILIISLILTFLLGFSAFLSLLQKYLLEIYKRKSFVRISSELFIKSIYTDHDAFRKRNTRDLSSRFFEIFNIQSAASMLIVEGLLTVLQIVVSFTLSSFYHPYLLIMNLITLTVIIFTWTFFKKKAIQCAIHRSEAKFSVFAWLDDVFRMNSYFKTQQNKNYALEKGQSLISQYIESRRDYWKISFTQVIILTVLYVLFAVILFALGSILVVKGQLSLGQLVAAEIIFTTALFGVAKLSSYFDVYYSLVASSDELSHVFELADENTRAYSQAKLMLDPQQPSLELRNVISSDFTNKRNRFNFAVEHKSINLLLSKSSSCKTVLLELLCNLISPQSGHLALYKQNFSDFDPQLIRQHIWVIENSELFSCTIREYLTHGFDYISNTEINNILDLVELSEVVDNLSAKLETEILGNGFPLHISHIMRLKLARALIHKPTILIFNEICYKITPDLQRVIFAYVRQHTQMTVLHLLDSNGIAIHEDYDQVINLDLN